jgi:hypothetical protein
VHAEPDPVQPGDEDGHRCGRAGSDPRGRRTARHPHWRWTARHLRWRRTARHPRERRREERQYGGGEQQGVHGVSGREGIPLHGGHRIRQGRAVPGEQHLERHPENPADGHGGE